MSPAELRELPAKLVAEARAAARLGRTASHVVGSDAQPAPADAGDADAALPELSWEEVARHSSREDCWVVVDSVVYDMTSFLSAHPGGEAMVLDSAAGGDATEIFAAIHDPNVLGPWGRALKVGRVTGAAPLRARGTSWSGWQPGGDVWAGADPAAVRGLLELHGLALDGTEEEQLRRLAVRPISTPAPLIHLSNPSQPPSTVVPVR